MIFDNSTLKHDFKEYITSQISKLHLKSDVKLTLNIIQIGDDFASSKYVGIKYKVGASIGVEVFIHKYLSDINPENVFVDLQLITAKSNTGIIYQLPVPQSFLQMVHQTPIKGDVDLLGSGQWELWRRGFLPPTIGAIDLTLKAMSGYKRTSDTSSFILHDLDLSGKIVAVIGQGVLVGRPLLQYLVNRNATILSINKDTANPIELVKQADIVICAAGSKNLINDEWLKPSAVVIDAATSEDNGGLVGDVDRESIPDSVLLSPSPGGIGGLTVLYLFYNLLRLNQLN